MSEIDTSDLRITNAPRTKHKVYEVNLIDNFHTLPEYFDRIEEDRYSHFISLVKNELSKF